MNAMKFTTLESECFTNHRGSKYCSNRIVSLLEKKKIKQTLFYEYKIVKKTKKKSRSTGEEAPHSKFRPIV